MTVLVVPARLSERPRPRRRRVWVLAACLPVFLAAGIPTAIWFANWRSGLHALVNYPTYEAKVPQQVGETAYFGGNTWPSDAAGEPDGRVRLGVKVRSVRPVVRENTAAARIVVLECVRKRPGDESLGQDVNEVRYYCSTLSPFTSGGMTIGERSGGGDIVLAVTPTRPGTVNIAGVKVRYSSGLRHGVQRVGANIVVRTSN